MSQLTLLSRLAEFEICTINKDSYGAHRAFHAVLLEVDAIEHAAYRDAYRMIRELLEAMETMYAPEHVGKTTIQMILRSIQLLEAMHAKVQS